MGEPTHTDREERIIKVYVLEQETYFIHYDVFLEKDYQYYVKYQNKWKTTYETKRWWLEELVWEYPYWDDKLIVRLYEREVIL